MSRAGKQDAWRGLSRKVESRHRSVACRCRGILDVFERDAKNQKVVTLDIGLRVWLAVDTAAPLHHNIGMRLTVNLEADLYALARSLAREEDCTVSAAVNRLLRRSLPGGEKQGRGSSRRIVK